MSFSALSEVLGVSLPYDNVFSLRDRMWEISPTLIRYDITEQMSADIALVGLKLLAGNTAGIHTSGTAFRNPIDNFYQTDPISRA
jgi:NADH dehydrogenase (ubiquinone) Fe-S protein 1